MSSPRLVSLDAFRGLTMAAMVIVNNPGDWGQVYAPLLHAPWHGWTPTDLIFPFFVFIVGMSVTLSARSQMSVAVIVRRAAIIFALGLLLALYPRFDLSTVRIMGVLQRLALCYLAAALFYRAFRESDDDERWWASVAVAGSLLVIYFVLLRFVPVPGGTAGDLTPSGNLGAWLDRTLFGEAHLWRSARTWDPEGLLSTLPAVATALTGMAAGIWMRADRPAAERVMTLIGAGGAAVLLGLAWDRSFPINKNLWTSSYVLLSSGLACITFALCYWVLDVKQQRAWARPLVVLGVNALVLFVVSGLLVKTLIWIRVVGPAGTDVTLLRYLYETYFQPWGSPKNTSLAFAVANLVVLYGLCEDLYRRRWFLRV